MNKKPGKALLVCTAFVLLCTFFSLPCFLNRTEAAAECSHKNAAEVPYSRKDATCTTPKTRDIKCPECLATWTEVLSPALGHDWNRTSATCTQSKVCKRCDTVGQAAYGHHADIPSATCTQAQKCTTCQTVMEAAKGHSWNLNAATCTANRSCTRCGHIDQYATGHDWRPATCTTDQTCSKCGAIGEKAYGHHSDMPTATCTQDKVCSTCQIVLEKATGHKWNLSSASCTEDKKCSKCGKIEAKATGHDWSPATCTTDQKCKKCGATGEKAYGHHSEMPTATCTQDKVCSSCGIVLEKATGHKWNLSAASCTEDRKCSKCGKIEQKATGHDWSPATCTADQKCKKCGTIGQRAYGHHSEMPTATCTQDKVCSSCGLVLEKATGHKWNRTAASCTEDRKCSKCGKIEQKATGHSWTPATCTTDQKCKICGAIGQKAYGHSSSMPTATCTEDKVCSSCGLVLEKATGHKWNRTAASCTEDRTCSECGKIEQKATGHDWSPATCTTDQKCKICGTIGQRAYGHSSSMPTATCTEDKVCSSCGLVLEKATGHKWNRTSASCTEDKKCTKCGEIEQKATGHFWSPATCTEPQKCKSCGAVGSPAYGHHAKNPSATCLEDNICTSCGIVLEKALNHKWDRATASCTEAQKCLRCGTTGEKAKGHDFSVLVRDVAPTCGEAGVKEYKCSRCSETRGENTAPNQKHKWEVKETVKETTESDGYVLQYCPVCGLTQKTVLTKVGELKVNSSRLSFSENADNRDISLLNISNAGSVVVSLDPGAVGWVRVTRSGTTSYKVEVSKNTEGSDRKGVITFKDPEYNRSVSVEVSQSSHGGCKIMFDPNGGIGWHEPVIRTAALGGVMGGAYPEPPQAPAYKTFDGWYSQKVGGVKWTENTPVPGAQGVTLYAHWADTRYYIAYDGNNYETGEMDNTPATCNQDVTLAKNKFTKTGYVLAGWNTRRDGKGAEYSEEAVVKNLVAANAENGTVVTLYAHWIEIAKVKVSFNVNGGSDPDNRLAKETRDVVYKEPYGDLPDLPAGVKAPEGKVFAGWETKAHVRVTAQSDVEDASDHVLYAVWRENTYKIHFEGNGNLYGVMDDQPYTYGESFQLPQCAFDDGKGFEVWSTTPTGTGKYAANFTEGSYSEALIKDTSIESITLYAIWKEHHYTVEYYDPFHRSLIHKDEKWENKHIYYVEACAPEIEGLRFVGYTTDYKLKGLIPEGADRSKLYYPGEAVVFDDPDTFESSTIMLFCVYEVTQKDYIPVIYHDNGGDLPSRVEYIHWNTSTYQVPSVYYYDSEEHEAERPHKKGYVFWGWGLTSDAKWSEAVTSVPIKRGTTVVDLYAIWSPNGATVTLDYGYGNKRNEELNPLGTGTFMLPNAKRDDYIFLGWQSDYDGAIYQAEEEISDLPTDLVLTALWEQRTYQIEFIDRFTGKVLKSGRYLSTESLDFEPEEIPIKGKTFDGWVYGTKIYTKDALVSDFVDIKTNVLAQAVLKRDEKVYRLYSHYESAVEDGKLMVYYHLNSSTATGGPEGPTTAERKSGNIPIKTSAEEPTDPHRVFRGWTTTINGRKYTPAGETYVYQGDPSGRVAPPTEITLYACWVSKYKLTLDKNGCPEASVDTIEPEDVAPGQVIQMKKYKKSFGEPEGYTLLGWGISPDTVTVGVDGEFTVPERDVTLYAIWSSKEYVFKFCDAFGREIVRRNVKADTTVSIAELDVPDAAVDLSCYRFAGWDGGSGKNAKRYSNNESIAVTGDMTFYAAYELMPGVPGKVVIHYLANGGTDAPATETRDPGVCYISTKVPTRDGYYFRGWAYHDIRDIGVQVDTIYPNFPVDGDNKITGQAGQRIVLYAVWDRIDEISINVLQEALEATYGIGAFDDDKLLANYVSRDWEKLNDTTYYVIRTARKNKLKDYGSTVMVMQYRNGTWNLDAYGELEGFWTSIRFDILTSLPNTSARALDITFDVVNTAAELGISFFFPTAGIFVEGIHYANTVLDVIRENEFKELYDAVLAEAWDVAKGKMKDKAEGAVLMVALKNLLGSDTLSEKQLGLLKDLTLALFREVDEQISMEVAEMDPYGSYDYAFGIFKERVAGQKFSQTIVDHTYQPIQKIYEYVFSNISGF